MLTPYYERDGITLYCGSMQEVLPQLAPVDLVFTDPPYGVTHLKWDRWVKDFPLLLTGLLRPGGSFWCMGSLQMFWAHHDEFADWQLAQELVWEKHNGSSLRSDRFRRVHELIVQFYRGPWKEVYKQVPRVAATRQRTIARQGGPAHWGRIERSQRYEKSDRLMRSVIYARSMHGRALNPTQKPESIAWPVIEYSCPPGGTVLDPFMGSGSFVVAARQSGRRAIGIDMREGECQSAVRRLAQSSFL